MKRLNIEEKNLKFKNLVSGPAPTGRILNYLYYTGSEGLRYKPDYRNLQFENRIGYAWTTEFMLGLGLVCLGDLVGKNTWQLTLTSIGEKIYDAIRNGKTVTFSEDKGDSAIETVREQMRFCSPCLYELYKFAFVNSIPFNILAQFLEENGYCYPDKYIFMDDYFECVKQLYDDDPTPYNRDARTPTGRNRVPSLIQLCKLFHMIEEEGDVWRFVESEFKLGNFGQQYTREELQAAFEKEEIIQTDAVTLAEKYGIDGNVLVESIVRNSQLQDIFKHNLLISQNERCVMCGISNRELLIGSHIKPASKSNVDEKADHNNGLLLCCNHDKLFDRYLITFESDDGCIKISKAIQKKDYPKLLLDAAYHLPQELLTDKRKQYLAEHNKEFYKKEGERLV